MIFPRRSRLIVMSRALPHSGLALASMRLSLVFLLTRGGRLRAKFSLTFCRDYLIATVTGLLTAPLRESVNVYVPELMPAGK